MDEYFEYLVERAQYYERFEFFRKVDPDVQVGLNSKEQRNKKVNTVKLSMKSKKKRLKNK